MIVSVWFSENCASRSNRKEGKGDRVRVRCGYVIGRSGEEGQKWRKKIESTAH